MDRSALLPVALTAGLAACSAPPPAPPAPDPAPTPAGSPAGPPPLPLPVIDWAALGVDRDACVVVRDLATGAERVSDEAACRRPRRPYSTFKIVNALIALDLGLLSGPDDPVPWDRERYPEEAWWPDGWRQEHTLATGMAVSSLPVFRGLAARIGPARMQAAIDRLGYGNRDLSGGPDSFWVDGAIRISARAHADLVADLARGALPAGAEAQAATRAAIRERDRGDARLYGKTGTGRVEDAPPAPRGEGPFLAWKVGWIEQGGRTIVYALWLEADGFRGAIARRAEVLDALLAALGVPPADPP